MNIIKKLKYRVKANNLVKLNKPIELMPDEELSLECMNRVKKLDKTNKIDERTNQIIETLLNRENGEKRYKETIIAQLCAITSSYELKQEILTKYAKYINEDYIWDFFDMLEDIETRQNLENNGIFKRLSSNKNTVYKEKEVVDKRLAIYEGIVFIENLEKIDLMSILEKEPCFKTFEVFEKLYFKLPEEQRHVVLINFFFEHPFLAQDENFKNLINDTPDSVIKEQLLNNEFGNIKLNLMKPFVKKDLQITLDDVKNFYRKYGKIPRDFAYQSLLNADGKKYTKNELLEELKYLKDNFSKKVFLDAYTEKMDIEQINNLIFNQDIDSDLRLDILDSFVTRLSNKDKISIFNKLDEDIKNKAYETFSKYNITNDEEDIDDKEYVREILSQIHDEDVYNKYVIKLFRTKDIDADIVFNVLRKNPQYMDDFGAIYRENFLKFSDEQIKKLYEKASDKAKSELVDITRRKEYFYPSKGAPTLETEDDEPQYIIVNEKNYFDLLENAEELTLKKLISFEEYERLLTNEQRIGVINRLKHYSNFGQYFYEIMPKLYDNLSIKEIKDVLLKIDDKQAYEYTFGDYFKYYNKISHITEQELENELIEIGDIKNKSIQIKYVMSLLENYKKANDNALYMLEKLIKSEDTSIENKYLYLSGYFRQWQQFDGDQQKEIIKSKGLELYKYINELAGKEKYNVFENNDDLLYKEALLPYFYDDKVYETLMSLYESNHNVINTISPALLNKNVLDKIDYELIEFYSRYNTYSSLEDVLENEDKAIAFVNSYNKLSALKSYPEEDLLRIISIINRFSKDEIKDIDFSEKSNVDKLISISQSPHYFREIENFDKYEEQIKVNARNIIDDPHSSRVQLLDAVGKRFFNLSYEEIKNMVIKYNEDSSLFINQYESKDQLTPEEQNELSALKTIRNLKEIISIKDKKSIIDTFNELDKDENFQHIDFTGKIALDENAKRVFNKDYIKDLYSPDESDKVIIDGIEVYKPKEFKMLVHVVGAYSDFSLTEEDNSDRSTVDVWNNNENKQSHILCTSYIRNSNLSYAKTKKLEDSDSKKTLLNKIKGFFKPKQKEKKEVILGFKDFGVNAIQMSNTSDIAVQTNEINNNAYRYYTFRSADNLSNCTRDMYNEVDIERRLENDKINNIKPSYVVCFDEITEESKKVANDFRIPIVYLNNRDIAKNESEKLEKTFDLYKNTKNPKLLKDIIVQYMNNTVSFSFNRKDLMDEYFNGNEMTSKINGIVTNLIKQHEFGNRERTEEALSTLYEAFNDEIKNYLRVNAESLLYNNSDFNIKQFAFDLKNTLKSMGINKENINGKEANRNSDKSKSYQDKMFTTIKQAERKDKDNER